MNNKDFKQWMQQNANKDIKKSIQQDAFQALGMENFKNQFFQEPTKVCVHCSSTTSVNLREGVYNKETGSFQSMLCQACYDSIQRRKADENRVKPTWRMF